MEIDSAEENFYNYGEIKKRMDEDMFDTEAIAPIHKAQDAYYLELFHGATIAFKDMALSILPHLLTASARKNGVKNEIVILTATSGDTGKAALAGFAGVKGTKIIVFYPKDGVSPIQERQMVTQKGENKVLYDFFATGIYDRNREFLLTSSPSMDILISSNLERLIYRIAGEDDQKNSTLMDQLKESGRYEITPEMKAQLAGFYGNYATEEETAAAIREVYEDAGYIIDTHTAVAAAVYKKYRQETGDSTKAVIASTASPYKFTRSVMAAIDRKYQGRPDFELVDELEKLSGVKVPKAIEEIRSAEVVHKTVCEVPEMPDVVKGFLKK